MMIITMEIIFKLVYFIIKICLISSEMFIFSSYNGEDVRLMIWDTAGQEEFDAITKAYYRGMCTNLSHTEFWPVTLIHIINGNKNQTKHFVCFI